jgi:hypothetical protein
VEERGGAEWEIMYGRFGRPCSVERKVERLSTVWFRLRVERVVVGDWDSR